MGSPIRVLVVDDSNFVRKRLARGLSADPDIEVVGLAEDAFAARRLLEEVEVDVMTLDVEMPKLNGLDFLRQLMPVRPMPVVMVSSLTREGASVTLASLAAGAVDFVGKPTDASDDEAGFMAVLCDKVKCASRANLKGSRDLAPQKATARQSASGQVILIGASTGGPDALTHVMEAMPADGPPVLIVQHMPARYTPRLAEQLDRASDMNVVHATDGDPLEPGKALLAPGGMHMTLRSVAGGLCIGCRVSDKVNGHIPSVDVLFHSAVEVLGRKAIGVVLTGMGDDGARGLLALREAGARTLAQDEATSIVFGMPKAAEALGAAERMVPLDGVARAIFELVE